MRLPWHDFRVLNCSNNNLTSLPKLPDSLEKLDCANNQLRSLPALSDSLEIVYHNNPLLSEL